LALSAAASAASRFQDKGVRLIVDPSSGDLTVAVDADRMGQVLGNLLDNALRHTPAGGEVHLNAARQGQAIRLSLTDSGEGIAAEHLPHIFERFYRADTARDREHGGSGIGLAITRALVEAQGGTIVAQSAGPGQGTSFIVSLPGLEAGADAAR
jgi:signal transduction histidine kinase